MREFVEICQKNGIHTRIVECALKVEFSLCEDAEKFLEEYSTLHLAHDDLQKWFARLQSKDSAENAVLLEILMELYKKVNYLVQKINHEEERLLKLDSESRILALGHEVLWVEGAHFEAGREYYLRFVLPNFSDRIMPVFAKALSAEALLITRMHPSDVRDFDSFVVAKEMEKIRWQKQMGRGQNDQ